MPYSRYSTSRFQGLSLTFDLWWLFEVKMFSAIESSYLSSYQTSIDTFSLSRTVFMIYDFKIFGVRPWPLTIRGHPRSNMFSLFKIPYRSPILTSIVTFSPYRAVFEIFDFNFFGVWPWPLIFEGHLESGRCSLFEIPNTNSYLTHIDTFSLSRTVFEIFELKNFWGFYLDLWSLVFTWVQ